jgi:hypothetical protein
MHYTLPTTRKIATMNKADVARAVLASALTISKSKLQDILRGASEREFAVIHDQASKCIIVRIKLKP